jgi:hypothetical protein
MSDESASSGEGEAVSVLTVDPGTPAELTMNGAAKALADMRFKRNQESSAESAEPATAEPELAQANPESPEGTAEGDQETEPAKPAIDPPKSWTKDLHDHWASLDPVLQERIVARDREDQAAIKRAFNEAADERKAVKAEREAAEKVRQQYEAKLPSLMNELESVNQAQFGDIKTMDDVVKLQAEDPFRFQAWQVHQMRLQAAKVESDRVNADKSSAEQSNWMKHVQEENAKAVEFIPELADKAKGEALTKRVASELLPDLGFKDSELADLATGKSKLSIYDHRVQRLLADALKLRDIQSAPKAVAAKPLPPVQKPGTSKPSGGVSERVQALDNSLTNSGSLKAAQQLLAARRASQRRAS